MSLRQAVITISMVVGSATLALTQTGCSRTGSPATGTVFTADEEAKAISMTDRSIVISHIGARAVQPSALR